MLDLIKRLLAWFGSDTQAAKAAELPQLEAEKAPNKGPFLFVDLYHGDRGTHPDFTKLRSDPRFVGVILKAWQGTHYNDGGFLKANWEGLRSAGLVRGAYLYLDCRKDGATQANAYWAALKAAGGLLDTDVRPILDVERADNQGVSAVQVIMCVSAAARQLKILGGRPPIFYGRGILEELGITVQMGCKGAWNPSYTAKIHNMPRGWDLVLWQYCGGGDSRLKNYPAEAPGLGRVDISCYPWGSTPAAYDKMLNSLTK